MARRFIDAPNAALGLAGPGRARRDAHRRERPRALGADPRRERRRRCATCCVALPRRPRPVHRRARRARPRPAPAARVAEELAGGNTGVERLPGKHGTDKRFTTVIVMVDDRPGELARLLTEIGEIGVNLEDLRLEHSPGAQVGLAEIAVLPEARRSTHQRAGRTRLADRRLNVSRRSSPSSSPSTAPPAAASRASRRRSPAGSASASSTPGPRTVRWRGTSRHPGSTPMTRHPSSRACRASPTASAPTPPATPCTSATST